jgi:dipeptidyl aminopeptidase/acylaminoacyl peptidase
MNSVNIFGSSFNTDETKILISSNKSGIYNTFEIDLKAKNETQLTHSTVQATYAISYFPNDQKILLKADNQGNEIFHLLLRDIDGKITDLTPDSIERAEFKDWSRDGKSFYYTSTKRNPQFQDVYKMDVTNFKSELIFENNDGLELGAISPTGKYLAFIKIITNDNIDIYLYNTENKELTLITNKEGEVKNIPSQFSLNEKQLFFLTDENCEFTYLKKYSIENKEVSEVYKENWDLMYAYYSYNEKYFIVGINKEAKTVIKVFDNQTNKEIMFPKFSSGNITSVNVSKSENLMSFYVSSSQSPNNLYIYNFKEKAYTQLTHSQNKEVNSADLVDAEIIKYRSFDGLEIPAILYKPHSADSKNKVPTLVWVHGGPGGQSRLGYSPMIQYLVNHGYAILAVNNRGSSGYGKTFYSLDNLKHGQDDLQDCIYAKKFLASTNWADTSKVGIIGGSYGGFMVAAALAFTPDEFAVGVNIFGVTNWLRTLKSIPPWWTSFKDALYKEMGNPFIDSAYLYKISPLFHANKIKKPFMVLQGANDPRVLKVESDEIVEAAKKNNIPVKYIVFEDEGHGFKKKENEIKAYKEILLFLDEHLKKD